MHLIVKLATSWPCVSAVYMYMTNITNSLTTNATQKYDKLIKCYHKIVMLNLYLPICIQRSFVAQHIHVRDDYKLWPWPINPVPCTCIFGKIHSNSRKRNHGAHIQFIHPTDISNWGLIMLSGMIYSRHGIVLFAAMQHQPNSGIGCVYFRIATPSPMYFRALWVQIW